MAIIVPVVGSHSVVIDTLYPSCVAVEIPSVAVVVAVLLGYKVLIIVVLGFSDGVIVVVVARLFRSSLSNWMRIDSFCLHSIE